MTNYLVEYEGKIIGSYNNYHNAETFILSCLQNNFMTESALIYCFRSNSCYKKKTNTVTLNYKLFKNNEHSVDTTYSNSVSDSSYESSSCNNTSDSSDSDAKPSIISTPKNTLNTSQIVGESVKLLDYNNPAIIEMAKQKIELQHKINILKVQKEKIEESKRIYDNDLKLFNIFKESKQTHPDFIIPELFTTKFEIIDNLHMTNNLSWENFIKNYQQTNNYEDYFGTNSYDNMFITQSTLDTNEDIINEELDINTDSD